MDCIVTIETAQRDLAQQARTTAQRFRLPIVDETSLTGDALTLAMRDDGFELRDCSMKPGKGVRIDFTNIVTRGRGPRGKANLSRRQPLGRAVGRDSTSVIDATAGLGGDASLLAAMGLDVIAVERHPALFAMLQDALLRGARDPDVSAVLGGRLAVVHADAAQWLQQRLERGDVAVDCVYLDPMFPAKRRASALANKEIRMVRALVGDDDDAVALLAMARRTARRVAVKRPRHAPPLASDTTAQIRGTLVRYDIYLRGSASSS